MSNLKATEIIEEIENWNPDKMDDEIYKLLKEGVEIVEYEEELED